MWVYRDDNFDNFIDEIVEGKIRVKGNSGLLSTCIENSPSLFYIVFEVKGGWRMYELQVKEITKGEVDNTIEIEFNSNAVKEIYQESLKEKVIQSKEVFDWYQVDAEINPIGALGSETSRTHFMTYLVMKFHNKFSPFSEAYDAFIKKFDHLFLHISEDKRRHRFRNPLAGISQRDSLYDGIHHRIYGCAYGHMFPIKEHCGYKCEYKETTDRKRCDLSLPSIFLKKDRNFGLAPFCNDFVGLHLVGENKISLDLLIKDLYPNYLELSDQIVDFMQDFNFNDYAELKPYFILSDELMQVLSNYYFTYNLVIGKRRESTLDRYVCFKKINIMNYKFSIIHCSNISILRNYFMDFLSPFIFNAVKLEPYFALDGIYDNIREVILEQSSQLILDYDPNFKGISCKLIPDAKFDGFLLIPNDLKYNFTSHTSVYLDYSLGSENGQLTLSKVGENFYVDFENRPPISKKDNISIVVDMNFRPVIFIENLPVSVLSSLGDIRKEILEKGFKNQEGTFVHKLFANNLKLFCSIDPSAFPKLPDVEYPVVSLGIQKEGFTYSIMNKIFNSLLDENTSNTVTGLVAEIADNLFQENKIIEGLDHLLTTGSDIDLIKELFSLIVFRQLNNQLTKLDTSVLRSIITRYN